VVGTPEVAEIEAIVKPHGVTDYVWRKTMVLINIQAPILTRSRSLLGNTNRRLLQPSAKTNTVQFRSSLTSCQ